MNIHWRYLKMHILPLDSRKIYVMQIEKTMLLHSRPDLMAVDIFVTLRTNVNPRAALNQISAINYLLISKKITTKDTLQTEKTEKINGITYLFFLEFPSYDFHLSLLTYCLLQADVFVNYEFY